ncbi:hypothetical protein [Salipaludibacillus daqingensis]|uniref:hypothetical protein n=1 Tax=Salipaludibacillus daqingensis TaxID=3041001 RepID=UPI002472F592|nr:hypothetical protein [Salipaludibacillus daqingensis]
MKKLLTVVALVAMLSVGTGVVGASDTKPVKETKISVVDSSFSTFSKPIKMD